MCWSHGEKTCEYFYSNKFVSKKGEVKSGNLCLQIIGYQVGYNDYKIYQFVAI